MEGFDISSIIGGLDPSQWGTALAAHGVSPEALTANAQASAPQSSPWEPLPGEVGGPAGPQPLPGLVGGPAGPPTAQSQGLPALGAAPAPAPVGSGNSLVSALRGMVAPTVPTPQKVSSPAVARPTGHIQSGELISLLGHLGMLRGAQMPSSYQLPSTLGAALGGGH